MPPFLRRIFAPLAIPGILRILAGFQALMYVLMMILGPGRSAVFLEKLTLDFGMVWRGEVWRLVSFMALPPASPFSNFGTLWLIFAVMFLFMVNDILEHEWGADGLSACFYTGVLGTILAGLLLWVVEPRLPAQMGFSLALYFSTAFVMAAGTVSPKTEIRLFFFIPVPLALVAGLGGLTILLGAVSLFLVHPLLGLAPLLCIANYLIWVLPQAFRTAARVADTRDRRARFEQAKRPAHDAFHTCDSCGATDTSHPERDFRVTAKGDECCSDCLDKRRKNP